MFLIKLGNLQYSYLMSKEKTDEINNINALGIHNELLLNKNTRSKYISIKTLVTNIFLKLFYRF